MRKNSNCTQSRSILPIINRHFICMHLKDLCNHPEIPNKKSLFHLYVLVHGESSRVISSMCVLYGQSRNPSTFSWENSLDNNKIFYMFVFFCKTPQCLCPGQSSLKSQTRTLSTRWWAMPLPSNMRRRVEGEWCNPLTTWQYNFICVRVRMTTWG